MIYVMQATGSSPVKIGHAADVEARRRSLQTGCAGVLVTLASCPGDLDCERLLHGRFEQWALRGEWFDIPADVVPAWDDVYLAMIMFDVILGWMGHEFPDVCYWPVPMSDEHNAILNTKGMKA